MNYKVFDAHCDTVNLLFNKKESLDVHDGMVRTDMLKKYNGYIQVFATWISRSKPQDCLVQVLERADKFFEVAKHSGFTVIEDAKTLLEVTENNKLGAILAMEDGVGLCGSLEVLSMLYRLGYRAITLTWNGSNELGCGAVDSSGDGLTDFGKSVVRKMNELGMVIDVSHLSEKGFWEVLELSEKPVMASHSNAKTVCNHPRNLTDEQLRALIAKGGVTGMNLCASFLNETKKADISDIIRHVEHIASLGGENIIGMGTDFDGVTMLPEGLENAGRIYKLFDELARLGYSDEFIEKLTYKNFVRLFSEII